MKKPSEKQKAARDAFLEKIKAKNDKKGIVKKPKGRDGK